MLAFVLMPAGVTLDYFVYPSLLKWLFSLRMGCDLALLFPLAAFSAWGKRYIRVLDKAAVVLPTIFMCAMIFASEGTVSPYYAGLNLVLTGVCLPSRTPWRKGRRSAASLWCRIRSRASCMVGQGCNGRTFRARD